MAIMAFHGTNVRPTALARPLAGDVVFVNHYHRELTGLAVVHACKMSGVILTTGKCVHPATVSRLRAVGPFCSVTKRTSAGPQNSVAVA